VKAIVYCGPPGAGKSYEIKAANFPEDTPILDMAKYYKEVEKQYPTLDSYGAYTERMDRLVNELFTLSRDDEVGTVVIEGIFAPASHSREWLIQACFDYNIDVNFVAVDFNLEDPVRRITADYERDHDRKRYLGRLALFSKYADRF